ncbi:MAG: hypothetical protein NBKEAIPA_01852 [Nitrospirae bacterium]|nr:hypothetical protein [Nitrospirota bacterium]MCE7964651.1 arylesterase [Nitrospira sp. NTP2]QOJ35174.1 MAG: arylesterase [Nitrospira sp.]
MTSSVVLRLLKQWGLGMVGAMALIGTAACDQGAPPAPVHSSSEPVPSAHPASADPRPRIVAFGDSLTAGLGVPPEQTYPSQLQRELDSRGYGYEVLNAGVSGETSAGGLRRVGWVLAGKPALVILELGGNDGLRGLSLRETRTHLNEIIRKFKDAKVPVLLAGMKLPPNYGEDYTSHFERMYQELALAHGIPFIPFFLEGVGGVKDLNQADGIHPTGKGYRIIAGNVLKSLLPILEILQGESLGHNKKA